MTNNENLTSMRDLFKQNGLMISNALTNIIPTSGIMEMLNMIDYEEIDVNSPVFKNISIKNQRNQCFYGETYSGE